MRWSSCSRRGCELRLLLLPLQPHATRLQPRVASLQPHVATLQPHVSQDHSSITMKGVKQHLREQCGAEPKRDYDKAWLTTLVDALIGKGRAAAAAAE